MAPQHNAPHDGASITFLGAAGTVSGSRHLLDVGGSRVLVDCGLFQGEKHLRERNWDRFPVPADTIDAVVLGQLLGLKIKVVTGYRVLTDIKLASDRGEVDGFCGLLVSALKTDYAAEWKSGRISVPIQMGLQKHPDIASVPNAFDLVSKEEDKQLFRLIFGPWAFGRPLFAPPGTPADRLGVLRAAFKATLADPEFIAETKKLNLEITPMDGDKIAPLIESIFQTPEPVLVRARALLGVDKR